MNPTWTAAVAGIAAAIFSGASLVLYARARRAEVNITWGGWTANDSKISFPVSVQNAGESAVTPRAMIERDGETILAHQFPRLTPGMGANANFEIQRPEDVEVSGNRLVYPRGTFKLVIRAGRRTWRRDFPSS